MSFRLGDARFRWRLVVVTLALMVPFSLAAADAPTSQAFPLTDGEFAYFSPDGKTIVAQDDGFVTHLWDASTGALIASIGDNLGVAYSPDGSKVVTSGSGGFVGDGQVRDAHSGKRLYSIVPPDHAMAWGATFTSDGTLLATANEDHRARIFDAVTGKIVRTFWGPIENEAVVFSPDGKRIATYTDSNIVLIWSVKTGTRVRTLKLDEKYNGFWSLAFSPNGKLIAAGLVDGAEVWTAHGRRIERLKTGSRFSRIVFSPDGKLLAVTGAYGETVWSTRNWRIAYHLYAGEVLDATFSRDGKLIATAGSDGIARTWNAKTGAALQVMPAAPGGCCYAVSGVNGVDFSSDDKQLVTSANKTMVWSVATGRRLRILHATN